MGFRDPFQYRSRSDIDKGYPDLHNGSKWSLKKIQKLKTNSLKLIASINLTSLDLRLDAIWLAQSYFQRYFTQNSFKDNTAVVFSTACIHMACKASDLPRPLDKVIKETYRLRFTREEVERKKIDDLMVFVEFQVPTACSVPVPDAIIMPWLRLILQLHAVSSWLCCICEHALMQP